MRLLYLFLILSPLTALPQYLTDFTKLIPEPSLDVTQQYNRISMHGDYLALGLPNYDSLGRLSGIVKIFKKSSDGWSVIATLAPSDPADALQFGTAVKLSSNYLLVSGSSYAKKVYLFKRPPGGWKSQTELTAFPMADGQMFGVPYQSQNTMAISDDEQTIAITDSFYQPTPGPGQNRSGAVFVYHKQTHEEWNGAIAPVTIKPPEVDNVDFGRSGVFIHGDRVITGTPFAPTGNGRLYVFRDHSGEFLDLQLEARLSASGSDKTAWLGYADFTVTSEGIFAPIGMVANNIYNIPSVVAFYEMPASGDWHDTDYTCTFPFHPQSITTNSFP